MFLNIKSEFNLQESTIKLPKLREKLEKLDQIHFAVCDYQSNQSYLKVAKEFATSEVKPVYGVEITINNQNFHLYAINNDGLKRINQIVYDLNQNVEVDELSFGQDIYVVIGKGIIIDQVMSQDNTDRLDKLKESYGLNLFVGLFSYLNDANNYQLFNANHLFGLKQVIIDAIKYIDADEIDGYLTLQAVKYKHNFMHFAKYKAKAERYLLRTDYNEVLSEAIEYTELLLATCDADPTAEHVDFPKYRFYEGDSATDYFIKQIEKGINWRFGQGADTKYIERIQYELNVIEQMGFVDYFLIVQDIVVYAKKNDILVGPGRGSAAGSLIAYVLGITDIDPIKYDLYFERFLNPKRQTMPDIDIDFEASKREEIITYIIERFGTDHVCKIGTINRYLAKSAFNVSAEIWKVDIKLKERISKMLDSRMSIRENLEQNMKLANEVERDLILRNVFRIAKIIEGLPSETSVHAAGVIIANENLRDIAALNTNNASLFEAKELEQMGLLKVDILALENLSTIRDLTARIKVRHPEFDLTKINLNDQRTFAYLSSAQTLGIFQMESQGMRQVLTKVQPKSFDELAVVLALYRPGAKSEVDNYVRSRTNFVANDPIEELLADTYGILLYQEQVLLLAKELANYSLADADIFRRAISKKDQALLNQEIEKFTVACINSGLDSEKANYYAQLISKFAGYGFNKAHAYAYSLITYQLAYMKANYEAEFMEMQFIRLQRSPDFTRLQGEFKLRGIKLFNPDIRYSGVNVRMIKGQMLIGFNQIKGINSEIASKLAYAKRHINNMNNIEEIIKFIEVLELSNDQITNLVYSGAFDYLDYNQRTLISNFKNAKQNESSVAKLFGDSFLTAEETDDSIMTKSANERISLGFNLKYNIFDQERRALEQEYKQRILSINEAFMLHHQNRNNFEFIVLIKIQDVKEINTKQNEKMAFLNCESDGVYDITCFPRVYANYHQKITVNNKSYQLALIKIQNDKVYLQKI